MTDNKQSKKPKRTLIPVSKTNFNRVKYGTHSLLDVLVREGYRGSQGGVWVGEDLVDVRLVDLTIKPKATTPAAHTPKANTAAQQVETP